MKKPLISMIMPVFNAELYLQEAVESIINQEFEDFEILIFDDGSRDQSFEILQSFHDSRISLFRSEVNQGHVVHLNNGLAQARGTYIARMDADDIAMPNRLKEQVSFLEKNPELGVLGSWAINIDSNGKELGLEKRPVSNFEIKWHQLLFYNPIIHPTVMVRRELIEKSGGYNSTFLYSEDYEFWSRLFQITTVANIPKPLIKYRKHETSVSNTHQKKQRMLGLQIMEKQVYRLLGKKIDQKSLENLWNCILGESGTNPLRLLKRMIATFSVQTNLSSTESKRIKEITAIRLLAMLKHTPERNLSSAFFFLLALKMSLVGCFKAFTEEIDKVFFP